MDFRTETSGDVLFDEASEACGYPPRQRHDKDPMIWPGLLIWSVSKAVDLVCETLIKETKRPDAIPEIVGRANQERTFNALVFVYDKRYFVSVHFGTLVLVQDLVHRVLCIPEAFPWIGDPSKEDSGRVFHPRTSNAGEYIRAMIRDPRAVKPRDPLREHCAALFNLVAYEFVVAHEIWHAVGGHLGWEASRSSSLAMDERPASFEMSSIAEDKRRCLVKQSLEMDADSFAIFQVLRRLLALMEPSETRAPELRGAIDTPVQAVELAIVCGTIMVGTFFSPSPDPERWAFRSHPPAAIRHSMMIQAADRALRTMKMESLRLSTTVDVGWVSRMTEQIFVRLWNSIGNNDRGEELKISLGAQGQEHARLVMEAWASVSAEVRAYSPLPNYPLYT